MTRSAAEPCGREPDWLNAGRSLARNAEVAWDQSSIQVPSVQTLGLTMDRHMILHCDLGENHQLKIVVAATQPQKAPQFCDVLKSY